MPWMYVLICHRHCVLQPIRSRPVCSLVFVFPMVLLLNLILLFSLYWFIVCKSLFRFVSFSHAGNIIAVKNTRNLGKPDGPHYYNWIWSIKIHCNLLWKLHCSVWLVAFLLRFLSWPLHNANLPLRPICELQCLFKGTLFLCLIFVGFLALLSYFR